MVVLLFHALQMRLSECGLTQFKVILKSLNRIQLLLRVWLFHPMEVSFSPDLMIKLLKSSKLQTESSCSQLMPMPTGSELALSHLTLELSDPALMTEL